MSISATRLFPRAGRIALALVAVCMTMFAFATGAHAAPYSDDYYTYYTTADLCTLTLTPPTADRLTGETHTVTATVASPGLPRPILSAVSPSSTWDACFSGKISALAGTEVKFTVTAGPHAGVTGTGSLDAAGQATFSYAGSLVGTDTINAELELADLCGPVWIGGYEEVGVAETGMPAACALLLPEDDAVEEEVSPYCGPQIYLPSAVAPECPTVTLNAQANVSWTSPPVTAQVAPTVSIAARKHCVASRLKIRPAYAGSTVRSSTLYVDGKRVAKVNGAGSFVVRAGRFDQGRHKIRIVTTFTDGNTASATGSFERCTVRTAARRVSPRFTG